MILKMMNDEFIVIDRIQLTKCEVLWVIVVGLHVLVRSMLYTQGIIHLQQK